jgi:hypothetical protein
MRKLVVGALTVAAFLLGTTANAQVCAAVSVGSTDVDILGGPPNNDRNLSIIAVKACDGTVTGQFHDASPSIAVHAKVTCLEVDGNDAWIGGIVINVTPASIFGGITGIPILIRVRDNGTSASDPPDQASPFRRAGSGFECASRDQNLPLYDLSNGQVRIMD